MICWCMTRSVCLQKWILLWLVLFCFCPLISACWTCQSYLYCCSVSITLLVKCKKASSVAAVCDSLPLGVWWDLPVWWWCWCWSIRWPRCWLGEASQRWCSACGNAYISTFLMTFCWSCSACLCIYVGECLQMSSRDHIFSSITQPMHWIFCVLLSVLPSVQLSVMLSVQVLHHLPSCKMAQLYMQQGLLMTMCRETSLPLGSSGVQCECMPVWHLM